MKKILIFLILILCHNLGFSTNNRTENDMMRLIANELENQECSKLCIIRFYTDTIDSISKGDLETTQRLINCYKAHPLGRSFNLFYFGRDFIRNSFGNIKMIRYLLNEGFEIEMDEVLEIYAIYISKKINSSTISNQDIFLWTASIYKHFKPEDTDDEMFHALNSSI